MAYPSQWRPSSSSSSCRSPPAGDPPGAGPHVLRRHPAVTHRLHHNHLYGAEDPDTAIHGGYPRGRRYLLRKLAQDLLGLNAWKTYAYFFGAPAINADTQRGVRPLDDTSPALRAAARQDRWLVVGFHGLVPLLVAGLAGLAIRRRPA